MTLDEATRLIAAGVPAEGGTWLDLGARPDPPSRCVPRLAPQEPRPGADDPADGL